MSDLSAELARHDAELRKFLCRFLRGDEAAAADVAQDTWTRIIEGEFTFDSRLTFDGWLFGIAARIARDYEQAARQKVAA